MLDRLHADASRCEFFLCLIAAVSIDRDFLGMVMRSSAGALLRTAYEPLATRAGRNLRAQALTLLCNAR